MALETLGLIVAGILGLVFGSFINVVIVRLPRMMDAEQHQAAAELLQKSQPTGPDTQLSLMSPRSACPNCGNQLKPWHNIPVISFLILRGRCAHCHQRISSQYPLIELCAAVIGLLAIERFGVTPAALSAITLGWLLLPAALIDWQTHLLPDTLTLGTLWAGLLASLGHVYGLSPVTPAMAIFSAATGYAILWSVERLFHRVTGNQGMGHGDFKLVAALCAWVGLPELPLMLFLSAVFGLLASAVLVLSGQTGRSRYIAFGPWLALSGWLALMYGHHLIHGYHDLIGI